MAPPSTPQPAFITFTGADCSAMTPELKALSDLYPIEWGVLIDPEQEENTLFPTIEERLKIQSAGLRLSAHICGKPAAEIVNGQHPDYLQLSGFSRLQINHGREGSDEQQIKNAHQFAVNMGMRPALQCQGEFPDEPRADWLYDVSFGLGHRPTQWPQLSNSSTFCGYSGGISPDTVNNIMAALPLTQVNDKNYWIDMESGVRTNGYLDIEKCKQVCQLVYGKR